MTCKNCIHYELCEKYISYIAAEIGKDDLPSFTNNAEKCVKAVIFSWPTLKLFSNV